MIDIKIFSKPKGAKTSSGGSSFTSVSAAAPTGRAAEADHAKTADTAKTADHAKTAELARLAEMAQDVSPDAQSSSIICVKIKTMKLMVLSASFAVLPLAGLGTDMA